MSALVKFGEMLTVLAKTRKVWLYQSASGVSSAYPTLQLERIQRCHTRMSRGHEVACVAGIAAETVGVEEDPAKALEAASGESNEGLSCGETVDHANTRHPRNRRVVM